MIKQRNQTKPCCVVLSSKTAKSRMANCQEEEAQKHNLLQEFGPHLVYTLQSVSKAVKSKEMNNWYNIQGSFFILIETLLLSLKYSLDLHA